MFLGQIGILTPPSHSVEVSINVNHHPNVITEVIPEESQELKKHRKFQVQGCRSDNEDLFGSVVIGSLRLMDREQRLYAKHYIVGILYIVQNYELFNII